MQIVLFLLVQLGRLPLRVLRALGVALGYVLYFLVSGRRRVVWINLRLCFPHWTTAQTRACVRETFVRFAQSWLDRGWLWSGNPALTQQRLRLKGALEELDGNEPCIIFAPHFFGLDAGWTALTQQVHRHFNTIYTDQSNPVSDAWILQGRRRYGAPGIFGRAEGVKSIVSGLRKGEVLYLLPDMNFGPHESLWVPFFGVPAATVPSLSRFARLAKAKVVPVLTRLTADGYEVIVLPAWSNFPTEDQAADTLTMNQNLQSYIDPIPGQYYWVHKRFKDQPEGVMPPY